MDVISIAVGAVGVGVAYFLYLAATKGLPAALAWVKAKWNAGKVELASLESDIADAHDRVTSLEHRLDSVESSIKALSAPAAPAKPATVSAAPAAPAAPAPQQVAPAPATPAAPAAAAASA